MITISAFVSRWNSPQILCLFKRHRTEYEKENQKENWTVFLNNTYLREIQQKIPCAELIHQWMYPVKRYCTWPIIGSTGGPRSCCRFLIGFRSFEKGLTITYPSWTNFCTRFFFFFAVKSRLATGDWPEFWRIQVLHLWLIKRYNFVFKSRKSKSEKQVIVSRVNIFLEGGGIYKAYAYF